MSDKRLLKTTLAAMCVFFLFATPCWADRTFSVAVCYHPGGSVGSGGSTGDFLLSVVEGAAPYLPVGDVLEAELVTFDQVAEGYLQDGGFGAAYFHGGRQIILSRPEGLDENLRQFVSDGGGLIAHCAAAAAFSTRLHPYPLPPVDRILPTVGILPVESSVALRQVVNLAARAIESFGLEFLASVDVYMVRNNDLGFRPGIYTYLWDGGVSFSRLSRLRTDTQGIVVGYDVDPDHERYVRGRPFFQSCDYGDGKVVFCPGSPEFSESDLASRTLGGEILFVYPDED